MSGKRISVTYFEFDLNDKIGRSERDDSRAIPVAMRPEISKETQRERDVPSIFRH